MEGKARKPLTPAQRAAGYARSINWRRTQKIVAVTLHPVKDRDIIDFLDGSGIPAATLAKRLIRLYMAEHGLVAPPEQAAQAEDPTAGGE